MAHKRKQKTTDTSHEVGEALLGAELQWEGESQRAELTKVLRYLLGGPSRAKEERFANYSGTPGAWSVTEMLTHHVVVDRPPPSAEELPRFLKTPAARPQLEAWLQILTPKCVFHPGRSMAGERFGKALCAECVSGADDAAKRVDSHVEPKPCFVVYKGNDVWDPIPGTGCAHWVAHQKNRIDGEKCLAGKTYRVKELIASTQVIARADVALGDIWANAARSHCGLVVDVKSNAKSNVITIRHDSSGQGGVFDNDFDAYFKGDGTFHR